MSQLDGRPIEDVFAKAERLEKENERLRRKLEDRKIIDRAKGMLMGQHQWSEEFTFQKLRRGAMNRRISMAELAQHILSGQRIEL